MTIRSAITPPQLRLPDGNRERHATYLEVFYDLVFVVAVGAASDIFIGDLSWRGAGRAFVLFVPVWWAWVGHTVYDTRFDTDDLIQRLWTFGMMLAAAGMAVTIPHAFSGAAPGYAVAYIGARLCLLALYVRARNHVAETRSIVTIYLRGFGIGAACWGVSVFVPDPARYALWALGLAVDFATPWLNIRHLQRVPVDTSHLPERFGSFTLIVLGEVILVIVTHVPGDHLSITAVGSAACAFVIAVLAWWTYFTFLDTAPIARNLRGGQAYIYLHLPIVLGLTMLGVGLGEAIAGAARPHLTAAASVTLAAGFLLWLGGGIGMKRITMGEPIAPTALTRYLGAIGLLVLGALVGLRLPALPTLALVMAVLLIHVVFETRYWLGMRAGDMHRDAVAAESPKRL